HPGPHRAADRGPAPAGRAGPPVRGRGSQRAGRARAGAGPRPHGRCDRRQGAADRHRPRGRGDLPGLRRDGWPGRGGCRGHRRPGRGRRRLGGHPRRGSGPDGPVHLEGAHLRTGPTQAHQRLAAALLTSRRRPRSEAATKLTGPSPAARLAREEHAMTQIDHQVTNDQLAAQDPTGRLYNHDLAPATSRQRTWNVYHLFSLWMNDAHNAGNYTWAAGLFVGLGMSAFDITVGIFAGCLVILGGCVLSGFMGQATGTPYPVISRITWGVWGANIPALVRGVVAIAWYGVQTYLASLALNSILSRAVPGFRDLSLDSAAHFLGLSLGGWICFLLLSIVQLLIVQKGMEVIRHVQGWGGPIIWVVMLGLMVYFLIKAD